MATTLTPRVPSGVPAGGQFATTSKREAALSLTVPQVDLDTWVPGEDVDADELVREELSRLRGRQVYANAEDEYFALEYAERDARSAKLRVAEKVIIETINDCVHGPADRAQFVFTDETGHPSLVLTTVLDTDGRDLRLDEDEQGFINDVASGFNDYFYLRAGTGFVEKKGDGELIFELPLTPMQQTPVSARITDLVVDGSIQELGGHPKRYLLGHQNWDDNDTYSAYEILDIVDGATTA